MIIDNKMALQAGISPAEMVRAINTSLDSGAKGYCTMIIDPSWAYAFSWCFIKPKRWKMKYIGYNKARSNQPLFHVSRQGLPLCGKEVNDTYVREGLPPNYFLCPDCMNRRGVDNGQASGSMTTKERAALNIRLCKEFVARGEHVKAS